MKTAVEWLYSEWAKNGTIFLEDLEQAKQTKKEQNQLWWAEGWNDGYLSTINENIETFKK
jgi:hypothetical protein